MVPGGQKGDVGCDRMVFAINYDLCLIEFDSKIHKWSLDQGQKTINPLIRKLKSLSQGPPQWSPKHICGSVRLIDGVVKKWGYRIMVPRIILPNHVGITSDHFSMRWMLWM